MCLPVYLCDVCVCVYLCGHDMCMMCMSVCVSVSRICVMCIMPVMWVCLCVGGYSGFVTRDVCDV